MTLEQFFQKYPKVAMGFSGGVDSSFLLYAAHKYHADVKAYFIKTAFQPQFELEDARQIAKDIGVDFQMIHFDVLQDKEVVKNPSNRCYFCKRQLFSLLKEQAIKDGYPVLLDGTNFSDDVNDRPGYQALQELQVLSPLRECELTKEEIRKLSKEANLFTWEKPAYACLATRIPTDTSITLEDLQRVENAEAALFAMGYSDFRVRLFHGAARIQWNESQLEQAMTQMSEIRKQLSPFFDVILYDTEVRVWNKMN